MIFPARSASAVSIPLSLKGDLYTRILEIKKTKVYDFMCYFSGACVGDTWHVPSFFLCFHFTLGSFPLGSSMARSRVKSSPTLCRFQRAQAQVALAQTRVSSMYGDLLTDAVRIIFYWKLHYLFGIICL